MGDKQDRAWHVVHKPNGTIQIVKPDGEVVHESTSHGQCAVELMLTLALSHANTVRLESELAEARAIIDKLPKYEDTGATFVPGVDEAWVFHDGRAKEVWLVWNHERSWWPLDVKLAESCKGFYSTREAAERAAERDE